MAPLKVPRLMALFWPMWSLAWELAPCRWGVTRGEGLPSEAWGFLLADPCAGWAAGDNGGLRPAGLA